MSEEAYEQRQLEAHWQELLVRRSLKPIGDLEFRPLPGKSRTSLTPAAVLLLLERTPGYHLVLTKRTQSVEHHKGEISFPGGMRDPGDANAISTALRETQEELGVEPKDVTVLGRLGELITVTEFEVTAFVGVIEAGYPLHPQKTEVERVLHVPLSHICEADSWFIEKRTWNGKSYELSSCRFGDDVIWGATARILLQFLRVVQPLQRGS